MANDPILATATPRLDVPQKHSHSTAGLFPGIANVLARGGEDRLATLTIAQIAQQLGLPESTVRYYRDHFSDYIPVIGEGRQRRYPAEAVEVFQVIADTLRRIEAPQPKSRIR